MSAGRGRIEVICGPMFCGKTEELIRRCRRATIAKKKVYTFKPKADDRYDGNGTYNSHSGYKLDCFPIGSAREAVAKVRLNDLPGNVIAFDEAQFFAEEIVGVVRILADHGARVIIAGLDADFRGEPFGKMGDLMCISDTITKLQAICTVCGEEACMTYRSVDGEPVSRDDPLIKIGASESYEARCRKHHVLIEDFVMAGDWIE